MENKVEMSGGYDYPLIQINPRIEMRGGVSHFQAKAEKRHWCLALAALEQLHDVLKLPNPYVREILVGFGNRHHIGSCSSNEQLHLLVRVTCGNFDHQLVAKFKDNESWCVLWATQPVRLEPGLKALTTTDKNALDYLKRDMEKSLREFFVNIRGSLSSAAEQLVPVETFFFPQKTS